MTVSSEHIHVRVLFAAAVGSAIEWFDYFLYGTLVSIVFSRLFFPANDPTVSLMLAYLSFSLTFLVRPLGGAFFSFIGDRVGRKKTLVMTLSLMGGATVAIGLMPTYAQIGIAAPIILFALRLIQGLGIGGEWGGALLLAYEYAPPKRRGLYGSLPQIGSPLGMLLSTLCASLVTLLPDAQMIAWGWRIPFLLSAVLVLVGLWIRKGIAETPAFQAARAAHVQVDNPLIETLRKHWKAVLTAIAAKLVETGPFYIFTIFVVSYCSSLGVSRSVSLWAVTAGAALATLTIPFAGWLSDRVGRRRMFLTGCALMIAFAAPYFMLLSTRAPLMIVLATVLAMAVIWPLISAMLGTLLSEIFSVEVRYTGISLGYQIGAALAGGTSPLIGTWLLARSHGQWYGIALFIALTATISGLAVALGARPKPETHAS